VIGWALRMALLWAGCAVVLAVALHHYGTALVPTAPTSPAVVVAIPAETPEPRNTIVFPADARGHVFLDAFVNGAPVQFLLDTGASKVALTPQAARAAGIADGDLVFDHFASTAAGTVRVAPVILREVRIDQLSLYDVPASVIEKLPVSLLGMTVLSRLRSWEMQDGRLTITW
jgi:aspartyl protease family protein